MLKECLEIVFKERVLVKDEIESIENFLIKEDDKRSVNNINYIYFQNEDSGVFLSRDSKEKFFLKIGTN